MPVYLATLKTAGEPMIRKISGTEISYELFGTEGPNLLLLHGWGCDGTLMQPVAKELQDSFRILMGLSIPIASNAS